MNSAISPPHVPESVPGRSHYSVDYIRGGGRIFSFAHQIDTVLSFEPHAVLEVGVGAGIVTAALRAARIEVTTLDIQPELNPNLVGSVTEIPAENSQFDVALCCQVLEHLPYEQFADCLAELRRVSRLGAVVSLPDATSNYFINVKGPKGLKVHWAVSRNRRVPSAEARGSWEKFGHHWEIGYQGYPLKRVLETMESVGWRVEATWRVSECNYHRFFKIVNNRAL